MGFFRRLIAGNTRVVPTVVTVPDAFGVQSASLGLATATYSPMSAGTHYQGPRGFTGLPGYGENRWAGAGDEQLQTFGMAIAPVALPDDQRLGAGYGASGQPGLPSTGDLANSYGLYGWLSGGPGPGMAG